MYVYHSTGNSSVSYTTPKNLHSCYLCTLVQQCDHSLITCARAVHIITCVRAVHMSRRVLVTGASGLLGRALVKEFNSRGWNTLGLAYSRVGKGLRKVDLCRRDEVEAILSEFDPAVVVHAAAERRPDVVEKNTEATRALNVTATDTLADLCSGRGAFLIYFSTDYVFDGRSPPYSPDAQPCPLNKYGVSKLDGESAVLQGNRCAAVLRIPVLYGPVESLEESAVTIIFKVVKTGAPAKLSDYERRYPTHVDDVANVCSQLASLSLTNQQSCRGIWHVSSKDCLTKYQMGVAMAEAFGMSCSHLIPVREPSGGAPRPYDCQLDCSTTNKHFSMEPTPFRAAIKYVLEPFQ